MRANICDCSVVKGLITMKLIFTSTFRTDWAIVALETCRTSHILNLTCFTIHYMRVVNEMIWKVIHSDIRPSIHIDTTVFDCKHKNCVWSDKIFLRLFVSKSNQDSLTVVFRGLLIFFCTEGNILLPFLASSLSQQSLRTENPSQVGLEQGWGTFAPREQLIWPASEFSLPKLEYIML